MNNIKLFYISKRNFKKAKNLLKKTRGKWAFAGSSYITHAAASNILGPADELRLSAIEPTAIGLLDDYINYIGELSLKYHSRSWWESIISEKNPFLSSILQNLCLYYKVKEQVDGNSNTIILVEDIGLYRLLADNLPITTGRFDMAKTKLAFYLRNLLKCTLNRAYFILTHSIKIVQARVSLRKYYSRIWQRLSSAPLTVIHAWIDARSFDANSNWRDSYFGELDQYLEKQDINFAVLPHLLFKKSFKKFILNLQKKGNPIFLEPHYFLKFRHIWSAALSSLRRPDLKQAPMFKNIDLRGILWEETWKDRLHNRIAYNRLYLKIPVMWKRAGLKVERAIYTFENHTWEKSFLVGLRNAEPEIKTVGYQHSSFSRLLTNYYISQTELSIVPKPDKILTTGDAYKKILSSTFKVAVETAGAFRYEYLFSSDQDNELEKNSITIAASINVNSTIELLVKSIKALENTGIPVLVKIHPVMPLKGGAEFFNDDNLPNNIHLTNKPIEELLLTAAALIYTETTVCLEALVLNVPPVRVLSDFKYLHDPLFDYRDKIFAVQTPEELKEVILNIMENREDIIKNRKQDWQNIIDSLFTRPSRQGLNKFLE